MPNERMICISQLMNIPVQGFGFASLNSLNFHIVQPQERIPRLLTQLNINGAKILFHMPEQKGAVQIPLDTMFFYYVPSVAELLLVVFPCDVIELAGFYCRSVHQVQGFSFICEFPLQN